MHDERITRSRRSRDHTREFRRCIPGSIRRRVTSSRTALLKGRRNPSLCMHPLLTLEIKMDPLLVRSRALYKRRNPNAGLYDVDEYPPSAARPSHWSTITPLWWWWLSLSYFRAAQTKRLSIDRRRASPDEEP